MKKVLIICLLAVLGVLNQANSQSQFIPEFFTNRPLILLNDATSVGWNPAVLGIDAKADLAFLAGYNRRFESNRLFGAFYSQNGFGVGITTQRNEQLPTYSFIPFSFYAGGGVKIPNERAWAGASIRYSEFGNNSIRFNGSFIYQPMEDFYVSAGITNFNSVNSDNLQFQFSSSYALLDWLNLFGRMQFTSDSMLFAGEKRSIDIGINASIQKNVINTSFFVNPVLREARFGLECSIGAFTIGSLNEGSTLNNPDGRLRGGNFLLRIDPEHFDAHEEEPCETVSCDVKGCKGRACTRALYGAYRCIRTNCPGIPCRDHCFGPECHPKKECTNYCPICQHPIINNWTVNILIKPHCTFCSCTHTTHNYYFNNYWIYNFPKEYITTYVHDTIIQWKTKFIHDTVYIIDTVVISDCPDRKDPDTVDKKLKDPDTVDKKPIDPNPIYKKQRKKIRYVFDSCVPIKEDRLKIDSLALEVLAQDGNCIDLFTHTDSWGTEQYNLDLAQCRAMEIEKILIEQGVHPNKIRLFPIGEADPIDTNETEEGRQNNRRLEYRIYPCEERNLKLIPLGF